MCATAISCLWAAMPGGCITLIFGNLLSKIMATGYNVQFSVIVPAYNSAGTIAACLKSVLDQSYQNFEVLVIDGLSTDDTVAIASSFKSDRIKVTSEKDTGIYDAMNKGIKQARGNWLYFLGSDDALFDDTIFAKINAIISADNAVKIIHGDVITTDGVTERYENYNFWNLVIDRCICHQAIFYHRAIFESLMYDTQYKMAADWDLNLKVFAGDVQSIYTPQVIATFNTGGVSGNWMEHPEYLAHFANRKKLVSRYKGNTYLPYYYISKILRKLKAKLF
ncbi:MAG: glycosyltransferase [Sphingobacteriaceae bacterium]|nr:MAG: glycosyltransferase [Sphingobacteriaceae bacterium]